MRIYDMKCLHEMCGRTFDWHTKWAIYEKSKSDGFRDVRCWFCGRNGAKRAYTNAPADITVKGTWGKHASPELRGKDYYTKQEHDRQVGAAGSTVIDSGDSHGGKKRPEDIVTRTRRDLAREAIEGLLSERGSMRLKDIISETGLTSGTVNDVIYKDPGRIYKLDRGVYGVTGAESQQGIASV